MKMSVRTGAAKAAAVLSALAAIVQQKAAHDERAMREEGGVKRE